MEQIILNYIDTFLGYGDPNNPVWFIGMEEGGGNDLNQLLLRFRIWNQRGAHETEDLVHFANEIGITRWFGPERVRLQPTWRRLIRIWLRAYGVEANNEEIRIVQANCLGRDAVPLPEPCTRPSPCLFELMPLPAQAIDEWPYQALAQLYPQLQFLYDRNDENTYADCVAPKRTELLRQRIHNSRSLKIVCFYGMDYLNAWQDIAGVQFNCQQLRDLNGNNLGNYCAEQRNGTHFIVSLHPAAIGVRNDYFNALGQIIQPLL
jgi:hypothetical protein